MSRPRAQSTTPQFSFRIDPELRRDLELLAQADDRTLGYYIERTMRRHRDANIERIRELRRSAGPTADPTLNEPPAAYGEATPTSHSSDQDAEAARHVHDELRKEEAARAQAPRAPKKSGSRKDAGAKSESP
jgi:hypothetical protein